MQREKTGAMIPARGRTARAGDPRRKGKREKASASLSLAGPGGEERGKRERERARERGAACACFCNCVSSRWRRVSLEREGSRTSAGGHVTALHSCGLWLPPNAAEAAAALGRVRASPPPALPLPRRFPFPSPP